MSYKVLFVFEGGRAEKQIVANMQKFYLNENTTVKCVYGAEIYQIYKEIEADNDLDTFSLIKKRNKADNTLLDNYNRDDFAEIYMFFDYDGHSTLADDNTLTRLLEFFNEETEKGKLFISYPMVEALKHVGDYRTFKDVTIKCKLNIKYKTLVADESLKELLNFNSYLLETWLTLLNLHLKKMNFIINSSYSYPQKLYSQKEIFSQQLEKYITPHSIVAVLSSFPIFLHDYYGNKEIKKQLEER